MTIILVTVLAGFALTLFLGHVLLPVLRALKAGQTIREDGPTWHAGAAQTGAGLVSLESAKSLLGPRLWLQPLTVLGQLGVQFLGLWLLCLPRGVL